MRRLVLAMTAAVLVLGACGPGSGVLTDRIDDARAVAGVDAAPSSSYLTIQAWVESVRACGRANGRPADPTSFTGETAEEQVVLTRSSATADDDAAAAEIFDDLPAVTRSVVVEQRWDSKGVGTYRCPDDGRLYATGVLSDFPQLPPSGRYVDDVFGDTEIASHLDVRYGTRPLCDTNGVPGNDLLMDIYAPSGDDLTHRPAIVLIHGGGFVNNDKSQLRTAAREYARKGWVAATVGYRTCPGGIPDAEYLLRVGDAIDDGMEAIRFLRANADTYGIDVDRIATFGSSAGGAISLGTGLLVDPSPGGPYAGFSHRPDAVVSTGAHLTPALELDLFQPDPVPTMMFHYEFDREGWEYAYRTCNEVHRRDGVCDFVFQPGTGHTISMRPSGQFWRSDHGPWILEHLGLGDA